MRRNRSFRQWLFFNLAYLKHPRWETGIVPPEIIDYAQKHAPGRALDIGCGSGLTSLYLAEQGWVVDGVDFSLHAILKARLRPRRRGLKARFLMGNAARLERLPLHPPYDLILDIGCLHSLGDEPSARAYAAAVCRLLRPAGDYLLYAHHADADGYPVHGINLDWVRCLFTPLLEVVSYQPGDERHQPPVRQAAWYFLQKPAGGLRAGCI